MANRHRRLNPPDSNTNVLDDRFSFLDIVGMNFPLLIGAVGAERPLDP
jgi:hypothetical protein